VAVFIPLGLAYGHSMGRKEYRCKSTLSIPVAALVCSKDVTWGIFDLGIRIRIHSGDAPIV